MSYEMVVGLNVTNDERYTEYRAAITPILKSYGGGFRYDFKVAHVLKNEASSAINRVFTINFTDETAKEKFFSDPEYLAAKERLYALSVDATTIIAKYNY